MTDTSSSRDRMHSQHKRPLYSRDNKRNKPQCDMDPEVTEKLQQIEAEGEPMSIAESITSQRHQSAKGLNQPTDQTSSSENESPAVDAVDMNTLQKMSIEEITQQATQEGVENADELNRKDLVYQILRQRVKTNGIMNGSGTLQILPDGFGFLRSSKYHYLNSPDDIYVSPSQIRKFNLKNGSIVHGQIRPPKENERYFALLRVEKVNDRDPLDNAQRVEFDNLTPLHPDTRIVLEQDPKDMSTRVVDLFAPIGFGQRGLIVSPPRAGKTVLMQRMAQATLKNYPEAYVIMLLVDERPEEVTDMERIIEGERCEVISSTFDEPASRHILVAEMVLEKSKRLVESGTDVVIFLDSITRLGRAWNAECPQSGKTLSGGLDANAMQKPKAFFGSARKLEEGGSLTIIATALIDTGSKMDDVIFEEFKGTGNLEIVLDRTLVDRRIWPAIDINASGTRREEKLFQEDEYDRICQVRRVLSQMNPPDAMDLLTTRLKKTASNAEFLLSIKAGGI